MNATPGIAANGTTRWEPSGGNTGSNPRVLNNPTPTRPGSRTSISVYFFEQPLATSATAMTASRVAPPPNHPLGAAMLDLVRFDRVVARMAMVVACAWVDVITRRP
jgi:hypothetical protein